MLSRLSGMLWCTDVFRRHHLPLTVPSHPRVCPDEASTFAAPPLSCLAALRDRSVPVEADLDRVEVVRGEIFRSLASICDHLCLVVEWALWIHTHKIIRQNSLRTVVSPVATDSAHCRSLSPM